MWGCLRVTRWRRKTNSVVGLTTLIFYLCNKAVFNLKFKESLKARNVWRVLKASSRPVRYRVSMQKVDFAGDTEDFYPPKAFTDSFLSEGAEDCKPYANSNF